jgi:hypothetical protein
LQAEHHSAWAAKHAAANKHGSCTLQSIQQQQQQQQQPQQHRQAQQSQTPCRQANASRSCIDAEQIASCINMAVTHTQLEAVCNAFLHHPSFSARHAALVVSRLHKVQRRPEDSQLLLLELLATKLAAALPRAVTSDDRSTHSNSSSGGSGSSSSSSSSTEQAPQQLVLTPREVAAVLWGFAWAGYQSDAVLVQQLVHQFWNSPYRTAQTQQHGCDQQQQQQDDDAESFLWPTALATLVAGLAGLGCRDSAVWAELRASAREVASGLAVPSLQQLAWGFATASQGDDMTTLTLAAATTNCLHQCTADELAQFVMSFHSLQLNSEHELFQSAARLMLQKVEAQQAAPTSPVERGSMSSSSTHSTAASSTDSCSYSQAVAEHIIQPQQQQQQQQLQGYGTRQQQQQIRLPAITRPQPLVRPQQQAPQVQQVGLQLPHPAPHGRPSQREGRRSPDSTCGQLLGKTTAICSAAVSHAYRTVLGSHDPLLFTMVLYRDYFQPAGQPS